MVLDRKRPRNVRRVQKADKYVETLQRHNLWEQDSSQKIVAGTKNQEEETREKLDSEKHVPGIR